MKSPGPNFLLLAVLALSISPAAVAQAKKPAAANGRPATDTAAASEPRTNANAPRQKFAKDVLHLALELPTSNSSDRLRVLMAAIPVANSVDPKTAKALAQEGSEIESRMIANGEKPAASVMQSAKVSCESSQQFVDSLAPTAVYEAEQSLLGAMGSCAKVLESVRNKLDAAMTQNVIAPRALLAAMSTTGLNSEWTKQEFEKLFSSLPVDEDKAKELATNIATLYAQVAPEVGTDLAGTEGDKFLEWLGRVPDGEERNQAISITTGAMQEVLGDKGYEQALEANVMARQVAQNAGEPGEVEIAPDESVSVLQAMEETEDRSSELNDLPPSLRARKAAASGFARGTAGDLAGANHYFDIAFSAVDSVWNERGDKNKATAVISEVCEAAAQVDPVAALARAQRLQDPAAEAIGMLAVARVVLTRQQGLQPVQEAANH